MAVKRGCGTRVAGAVYAVCPMAGPGEPGLPLEAFLFDPPVYEWPVEGVQEPIAQAFGLTPNGVQVVEFNGVNHILDWIGSVHYPNVADYLEEARRFGFCRRCEGVDYSTLTPGQSRVILIHARGHILNWPDYEASERDLPFNPECPKEKPEHDPEIEADSMCNRFWWADVEGGISTVSDSPGSEWWRGVRREMPAFEYQAMKAPLNLTPEHLPAFIASYPVHHFEIVRDRDAGTHEHKADRVSGGGIEMRFCDE